MKSVFRKNFVNVLITALFGFVLYRAIMEFYNVAWGSGVWWGEFSFKWGVIFLVFVIACLSALTLTISFLWRREKLQLFIDKMILLREKLGSARWLPAILIFISPVWFFQYTPWGVAFSGTYFRVLIWGLVVLGTSFFIKKGMSLCGWTEFLVALLLTSSEFVIAATFINVTNYPFSLGWSEGNRIWDYSIMFGSHLYNYPADKKIYVLLDVGRQFVGGLPFLIPGLTIGAERFWVALTMIIPYLLLGLAAFRFTRADRKVWLLLALWTLIFLKQGPIHPPLVLCAVVVALLWRSPLWLALPIIALTGYAADHSRFTWMFAPGIWIGMLELTDTVLLNKILPFKSWARAILLGLTGMVGGYFGDKIAGLFAGHATTPAAISTGVVSTSTIYERVSDQPLLWYRLLPNATYRFGILAALLVAILPLVVVLLYLAASKKWKFNIWQGLAILIPLFAFLVVGLIVSTKIGGGGDLHNMDMFLIGLVFAGVLAWRKGGAEWLANIDVAPAWIKLVMILLLAVPGFQSLTTMRSFNYANDVSWLLRLTDAPVKKALDMIPSQDVSNKALNTIRSAVAHAQSNGGEVLFMDQRQLLTFGYIPGVQFIPEYEKKVLMNEALSSDASYFKNYYADLAAHRFALIVSEPLFGPVKDSSDQFGEENNAWVKWISAPTLCYYKPKISLSEVGVQLLVPRDDPLDCSAKLP